MNDDKKVIFFQVLHKIKTEGSKIWNWSPAASEAKYFGDGFVEINNCIFDVFRRIFEDVLRLYIKLWIEVAVLNSQ